jgi:hypothetical protein
VRRLEAWNVLRLRAACDTVAFTAGHDLGRSISRFDVENLRTRKAEQGRTIFHAR